MSASLCFLSASYQMYRLHPVAEFFPPLAQHAISPLESDLATRQDEDGDTYVKASMFLPIISVFINLIVHVFKEACFLFIVEQIASNDWKPAKLTCEFSNSMLTAKTLQFLQLKLVTNWSNGRLPVLIIVMDEISPPVTGLFIILWRKCSRFDCGKPPSKCWLSRCSECC